MMYTRLRTTDINTTIGQLKDFPHGFGVSIAGAEFGTDNPKFSAANPGVVGCDYVYPDYSTIEPLARRGVNLFRIPVRWERLQPQLNQPLDAAELSRLQTLLKLIRQTNSKAIIDLHNYGRYRLATGRGPRDFVIDEYSSENPPLTAKHFSDFWSRIATVFRGDCTVVAYGLMNEPHDMGASQWSEISQKAVKAVRSVDQRTWILVAGDDWSSTERFETANGPDAWIHDPANRTMYEAHCYLDLDGSGTYSMTIQQEMRHDPHLSLRAKQRLEPFVTWCARNQVRGFIGEFGVPANTPEWNTMLGDMLSIMKREQLSGCCWAAGPWWGEYPLSLELSRRGSSTSLSLDALLKHQRAL